MKRKVPAPSLASAQRKLRQAAHRLVHGRCPICARKPDGMPPCRHSEMQKDAYLDFLEISSQEEREGGEAT